MVGKVQVSMGDNSLKNSCIEIPTPHAHLHITGRKTTKFQGNQIKDVGGVAEKDLSDGWTDGITHTQMDEGHLYSGVTNMDQETYR